MRVYVGTGQSLMVAFFNQLIVEPPDTRVKMFKDGKWQPAVEPTSNLPSAATSPLVAFGKEMVRLNPSTPIGIINCAVGSTTLDEWMPGSSANLNLPVSGLFEACVDQIEAAIRAQPDIVIAGILHNEGQSLAHECQMGYWSAIFPRFSSAWQGRYGNIPVVFAQLGSLVEECGAGYLDSVRTQQAGISAKNVFMITTMDLPTTDGVHFTAAAQQEQGRRFAQMIHVTSGSSKECSEPWWSRLFR